MTTHSNWMPVREKGYRRIRGIILFLPGALPGDPNRCRNGRAGGPGTGVPGFIWHPECASIRTRPRRPQNEVFIWS